MPIIRKLRVSAGMSQSELAAKLEVTQEAVSQWENGTSKPRVDTLIKLASILECTIDELLKG